MIKSTIFFLPSLNLIETAKNKNKKTKKKTKKKQLL